MKDIGKNDNHLEQNSGSVQDLISTLEKDINNDSYESEVVDFWDNISNAEDTLLFGLDNSAEGFDIREFGLDRCAEYAKKVFEPYVIQNWSEMSTEGRESFARDYAVKVVDAFELISYRGISFENLPKNVLGETGDDGVMRINNSLLIGIKSPLQVVDVITHELRHQYQLECVQGYHNVPNDVRKEWAAALDMYTMDAPWAYDPWGYKYNPLEIDSRYAGESVVRELSKSLINEHM